jgi:hypothetical protein
MDPEKCSCIPKIESYRGIHGQCASQKSSCINTVSLNIKFIKRYTLQKLTQKIKGGISITIIFHKKGMLHSQNLHFWH